MNHLANIVRKELKELLTPSSVITVLVMVVLFLGLGSIIGGEVEKVTALPVFGIANADDGIVILDDGTEWSAYDVVCKMYLDSGIPLSEIDDYIKKVEVTSDIRTAMEENGIVSLIEIEKGFGSTVEKNMKVTSGKDLVYPKIFEYYTYEPAGMFGTVSSGVVSTIVVTISKDLSSTLVKYSTVNKEIYPFVSNPVMYGGDYMSTILNGEEHPGVTPQDIESAISSSTMMVPIVIMIIIMMVGSIVISSMGSEKENKTLETLLTLPIRRTSIVTGKIVAAAIVGLIYGLVYMVGMSFYTNSLMKPVTSAGGISLADLGLSLSLMDYVLLSASMFMAILCALGLCMIMGAFAKNYKSAQTMSMPLSIMSMLPMFVVMFAGWYGLGTVIQAVVFAIPFSHPMMAMEFLMFDDYTMVFAGLAYMVAFAVATILITVRLYNSDILITGLGQNKFVQAMSRNR